MIQDEAIPKNADIEIDPVIINSQIEELNDFYEDFYNEYKEVHEEYSGLIIDLDECNSEDEDFIISLIIGNLRKGIDICEIYLKDLKHQSINTYLSVVNILKNYDFKIPGNEYKILCDTIAKFISFQYDLNFYNDSLLIWNDFLQDSTSEEENSEVKKLRNKISRYFTNLIYFNKEYLNNINVFEDEITIISHENNNKLLITSMSVKSLQSYIKYTNIEIKHKQDVLFDAFDDLADYINNLENESNPDDALDYIVDIVKNNIEWPFLFQFVVSRINSTIMTYGFDYLEDNFNAFSTNYADYLNKILQRFLVPHKEEMSRLLKLFTENSESSEHKSELIAFIDVYLDRLDNLIFDIQRFEMKYDI